MLLLLGNILHVIIVLLLFLFLLLATKLNAGQLTLAAFSDDSEQKRACR